MPLAVADDAHSWQAVWAGRGPRARMLWPLSQLYGAAVAVRRAGFERGWLHQARLPVPVVVVGNVVAGGAGKTPVVQAIARHCAGRGISLGIVSRGYGRTVADLREVTPESSASQVGDEPLLLHRSTGVPVFVAPRRADAARALLARYPGTQLIVCDDGLQHYALHRDVEICVFDERGTSNGWLLPAGPLREPWPRRVDLVLRPPGLPLDTAGVPAFEAPRALAAHAVTADGQQVPLASLRGRSLHALAGIARPEAFFAMLRAAGVQLQTTCSLPDHYDFDSWTRDTDGRECLICTEKDAVKLWPRFPDALAVPLVCTPEPAFWSALDLLLARQKPAVP